MEGVMNATYLLAILFFVVVIPEVTGWFIRRQTRSMGKFGLGPLQVSCPNCGAAQPFHSHAGLVQADDVRGLHLLTVRN
jgi:hypothetical protein